MLSAIFGIFAVLSAVAGYWVAAIICVVLMLISMEGSSDERAHYRARVNRDRYWAHGEEPDWKRQQRADRERAERDRARFEKAKRDAAAGRWEDVPWSLRGQVRREQKRYDAWLAEQERLAAEKRRKYMEQMRANRR